jgi:hypothetical protein
MGAGYLDLYRELLDAKTEPAMPAGHGAAPAAGEAAPPRTSAGGPATAAPSWSLAGA